MKINKYYKSFYVLLIITSGCTNIPNGIAPANIVEIKPPIKIFSYPMVIDKMLTNICISGSQYISGIKNIDIKRTFSSENSKNNDVHKNLWNKLIRMHIIQLGKSTTNHKLKFISEIKKVSTNRNNEFLWTIQLKSHNNKLLWTSSVKFHRNI